METLRKINKKQLDTDTHSVHSLHMNNQLTTTPKVNVTKITRTDLAVYVQATSGKITAFVAITEHRVQVICINASHKVHGFGAGRFFPTIAEAVAAYKKPEMKAIILAADALNA